MSAAGAASRRLHFEFSGDPQEVMPRVESVEAFLVQSGCSVASARSIAVVAEEILTNIFRHAWPGRGRGECAVDVVAAVENASVQVCVRSEDDGIAFDPTAATVGDVEVPLDERSIGGVGVRLITSMTDTQSYRRVGGRNVFEVTRVCPRERVE